MKRKRKRERIAMKRRRKRIAMKRKKGIVFRTIVRVLM
jgi:hypothetical protein